MDLMNVPAKVEVRSFSRSWGNGGYLKKTLGSPWIRRSRSSKVLILVVVPIESAYMTSY